MNMNHKPNVADVVTASRIIFALFILLCTTFSVTFYVFYLLGAFTDMIDGLLARKLNLKSTFGAKLDMIADFIFVIVVFTKVFSSIHLPIWVWIWIAMIAFIKFINLVSSLVLFRRIVPMHTIANKVTGFILFFLSFVIGRGAWQGLKIAVIVSCFAATFAAIQEGHFIRIGKEIE